MSQIYRNYNDLPLTLNSADVATVLGVSRMNAYHLCHGEGFPTIRIGKRILIPRDRFLAWLEAQETAHQNNAEKEGE